MTLDTKKAWVTFAIDEKTADEAIMLAKSLLNTATIGELVILTSYEIFGNEGDKLSSYFDVVLPQSPLKINNWNIMEILKMSACNLQMYSKCIILDPTKKVIKNCDELFSLKEHFATTAMGKISKLIDYSLVVLSPGYRLFKSISTRAASKKFQSLSQLFDDLLEQREKDQDFSFHLLSSSYNCYLCKSILEYGVLYEAKIFDYENEASFRSILEPNPFFKDIKETLESLHKNIPAIPPDQLQRSTCAKVGSQSYYKDSIAIIGHSCRFPKANNSEEFWDLINGGGDGITKVPIERMSSSQKNDSRFTESCGGFLKCPTDEFDAKFFGISPREATFMDPQQRLLLEVAWEALENAAINPNSLKNSNTGVFSGVWTHDYERLVVESASAQDFHHVVLGNAFSATSARVSYFLGLNGPNIAVESGCSSSMVGLHLACDSLRKGETDLSLVLGANLLMIYFPYSVIPLLAKDGHCKTFDEKADGFGRAEGVAVIVLKRLSDAIKSGDRIMGIIRGSALSNEGTTSSFGTPSKHCQEIAVKEAIRNASVDPNDVDYVEAHGTGTSVGDPIEFAALAAAYASPDRKKPLVVGSVKTNIGHTESAAGLAGVLKVLLSMKHETIPPNKNFDTLNPNIDLNIIPSIFPTEHQKWERNSERVRMAGVSSFGISGTNVHAILEEPPKWEYNDTNMKKSGIERFQYILPISAKSVNSLHDLCKSYVEYFKQNSTVDLGDVTFTAATGRAHFKHRVVCMGGSSEEMVTNLQKPMFTTSSMALTTSKPKIAFLFTGQGSQYAGMGKGLYESNIIFRSAFDECEMNLKSHDISLKAALWSEDSSKLLEQTMYSQLSIFVIEYSLLKLWNSFGIQPNFILGHSVGEFAASVAAGILNLHGALSLIVKRSRLIESLQHGGMLAIKASRKDVEQLISEFLKQNSGVWIDISVVNSSEETVVAGNQDAIILFKDFCRKRNKKYHVLAAAHAFHSREMDKIEKQFFDFGKTISYKIPHSNINYVSGTTGRLIETGDIDSTYWCRHARQTVNFEEGMKTLFENGCNVFIEIGSHPVLLPLGMASESFVNESIWIPSLRKNSDCWSTLSESVANLYTNGIDINWQSLYLLGGRKKLELPTYPFERQKYWTTMKREDFVSNIHPLLGKEFPLADQVNHIYQNSLNLEDFSYFKDHRIANITILPGAVFLETILAAGNHVLRANNFCTLSVDNFTIEAPFDLDSEQDHKMQVVTSPITIDGNKSKIAVKVYSLQSFNGYSEEKSWTRHAEATVTAENSKYCGSPERINEIKKRCETVYKADEIYKRISEVGIQFGESFQSIRTAWKGTNEALAEIPSPSDINIEKGYIFHPIVLDAIFQLFGLSINEENSNMYLPVAVEKFTVVSTETSEMFFAHAIWESGQGKGNASLYNEKNTLLAVMQGIRLVRTSVNSFLNAINSQRNSLPGMYQEVWRSRDGPFQSRVDLSLISLNCHEIFQELKEIMKEKMAYQKRLLPLYNRKYSIAILIKFLLELGWKPVLGDRVTCRSFLADFGISRNLKKFISMIFRLLHEETYFEKDTLTDEWIVSKRLPDLNEVTGIFKEFEDMRTEINISSNNVHVATHIVVNCLMHYNDLAFERITPHSLLFGNEDRTLNADSIYTNSEESKNVNIRMSQFIQLLMKPIISGNKSESVLRILEVGAGTGASSKLVIQGLKKSGIPFRYCFTDISHHFINEAKNNFADTDHIEFQVLDIEKDPLTQGFAPYHYDVIIAANVIHATTKLHDSISNIRRLLRQEGILLLQEMLQPILGIDMIFGTMNDFWKFNDYDIRPDHPCVSKDIWDRVFVDTGFHLSANISEDFETVSTLVTQARPLSNIKVEFPLNTQPNTWILECDNDGHYIHLSKMLKSIGRQVCLIKNVNDSKNVKQESTKCFYVNFFAENEIENCISHILERFRIEGVCLLRAISNYNCEDQSSISLPAFRIIRKLLAAGVVKFRLYVVTSGVYNVGSQRTMNPLRATLAGLLKSASNEAAHIPAKLIEIDPDNIKSTANANAAEIFYELFCGEDVICCYRKNRKFVMKLCHMEKLNSMLTLPQGRYTVAIPSSQEIADLQFKSTSKVNLKTNEVEVMVKATALNFRDLFVIIKQEMFKSQFDSVGSDFSGVITEIGSSVKHHKIGDRVYGISLNSCAASHVVVKEEFIRQIPKNYTFSEACTIPSVFLTAYFCLVSAAKLKNNETVLIHIASGGVGLVAIQISQQIGANIIATAGSHRKRAYLRSLGIKHVFHSRDLTFEKEIYEVTNGKGVDVVLNSLTGPGFKESTLRVCGKNARFIEIGKVNIWRQEEVLQLRPDVSYTIFDLEVVEDATTEKLVNEMNDYLSDIKISPLPFSRYPITQIKDALNCFAKADHIGKIVLTMPEFKEIDGRLICNNLAFSEEATYLVTGGLRGIGLEVAKWLVSCGARNIILVARSPPDENALCVIKKLRSKGCRVSSMMVDVGDFQQCSLLFDTIKLPTENWPPLKGIIHSAGIISDGTLINQTWEKYEEVFNPKVRGGWNLHNLSKDLPLEHFVVFSSMVAVLGTPGQSNHCAANMFLDSLINYRHSIGLQGQSINWGIWAEVGAAVKAEQTQGRAAENGGMAFSPSQGIAALQFVMSRPNLRQVLVAEIDIPLLRELSGSKALLLSELVDLGDEGTTSASGDNSDIFWNEIKQLDFQERVAYIKKILEKIIRRTLRLPDSEHLDEFQNFSEMGLDSLMAIEMKNKMQSIIGKQLTLTATSLLDHPTIHKLSNYLAQETQATIAIHSPESLMDKSVYAVDYELLKQDAFLPTEIRDENLTCICPSRVKSILLTGASGRLGIYILKDLLEIPSLHIVCLLRGKNIEQARRKLLANLKKGKLESYVDMERISIVIGNITEKNLGLPRNLRFAFFPD